MKTIFLFTLLTIAYSCSTLHAVTHEWTRQFGTTTSDWSSSVIVDKLGNVYISGSTHGDLEGISAGYVDSFISKFDTTGNLLWTEQFGSAGSDLSTSISLDGLGNIYISGLTTGNLGGTYAGKYDAFVSKHDTSGKLLWIEQLGITGIETSRGVSADGLGNVYITGSTDGDLGGINAGRYDAFLSKYDTAGNRLWTEQFGATGNDLSHGVSADGLGNVYITGETRNSLAAIKAGSSDVFLSKYDATGNLLWIEQLGSAGYDRASDVIVDDLGDIYISGHTRGNLGGANAGLDDAFLSKYDETGNLLWTKQLGSVDRDYSVGVSVDGLGNVYISGETLGDLRGSNAGLEDIFVSKYDTSGNLLWTEQFGTPAGDRRYGISADGFGNVYISGETYGDLEGFNSGHSDAFIAKFSDPVPEPSSALLVGFGLLTIACRSRRSAL